MTRRQAVVRRAPGKLFIAGEYAVVEPGQPAILAAVDRQITVTVSGPRDADVVITSDLRPQGVRLRRTGGALAGCGPDDERQARSSLTHVVSAVEVVQTLLAERGLTPPAMHLSISSRLHDNGTKLGLGSSGAVTVATVDAVAAYCGVELSPEARFRLAMLATARIDASSSGGDLAASSLGGWIEYRSPDRTAVLDMAQRRGVAETVRAPWPGLLLRRLPAPSGLSVEVGWTGEAASTATLVSDLSRRNWRGSASYRGFVASTAECVRTSVRAIERGERHELLHQIRAARHLLAGLDNEVRLGIFTSRLTAMCDAAEAVGGAAKPSGAGGGDCGIALLEAMSPRITQLRSLWTAAGVRPVPIHVPPADGPSSARTAPNLRPIRDLPAGQAARGG